MNFDCCDYIGKIWNEFRDSVNKDYYPYLLYDVSKNKCCKEIVALEQTRYFYSFTFYITFGISKWFRTSDELFQICAV